MSPAALVPSRTKSPARRSPRPARRPRRRAPLHVKGGTPGAVSAANRAARRRRRGRRKGREGRAPAAPPPQTRTRAAAAVGQDQQGGDIIVLVFCFRTVPTVLRQIRNVLIRIGNLLSLLIAVFRIRIQLNPDPAKNLHSDPNPEDLESGSGLKLFPNTMWKKIKITS